MFSELYERVLSIGAGLDWTNYLTFPNLSTSTLDGLAASVLDGSGRGSGSGTGSGSNSFFSRAHGLHGVVAGMNE